MKKRYFLSLLLLAALFFSIFLYLSKNNSQLPNTMTNNPNNSGQPQIYLIEDKQVTAEQFEVFLAQLKLQPETQTNGESPKGLFTSYEAADAEGQIYRITIDGPSHSIKKGGPTKPF